jgi:hypothetical protein
MVKSLFFSIWFLFHPVHVTFTSIDYAPELNSFNVFIRMYFDDFQRDCKLRGVEIQEGVLSTDNSMVKIAIEKYIGEVMMIRANEKQLSGKLLDLNIADNELSMNMEYKTGKNIKKISVKNQIFTGLYTDQSNMVILKINDFEEGFKLTSDKIEQTFNLK